MAASRRLSLTDPSDLGTTGIEIVARPPGKKAQALAMLSGGERALTAVALLFAMLEVRPGPVLRARRGRRRARRGEHRPLRRRAAQPRRTRPSSSSSPTTAGTIEAADALYGVTVGDDSVSRVISLRLDEAQALAARDRRRSRRGALGRRADALLAPPPRRATRPERRHRAIDRRPSAEEPEPVRLPAGPAERPSADPRWPTSETGARALGLSPSQPDRADSCASISRRRPGRRSATDRPGRRRQRRARTRAGLVRRPRRRSRADARRLHVAPSRHPRRWRPREGPSWDDVEETLIAGDVGAALAIDLVERARRRATPGGPEAAIRAELAALLVPRDVDWSPRSAVAGGPAVVLVVGVNGTGKTTTIGKLASRYAAEGRSVILAAADTFRAAAIDQLRIWADRARVPMIAHAPGADPGAVVYDALDAAVARGADLVIADTAGRLHTKSNLMDELAKVRRIIDKRLPGAGPGDALRPRRHDRPERPRPGEGVPRGRRPDRDRPDQARLDRQGRHRLRHRGRAAGAGPLRRGGGGRRRPHPVRPGRVRGGALRLSESAADGLVALHVDDHGRRVGQRARGADGREPLGDGHR